jgi:uncharacterized protein (DUF1015 family)
MPRIAPFEALVYDTAVAGPLEGLTARPYDVINEAGRRDYSARSPHNIVHVDLGADPAAPIDERYRGARATLASWADEGVTRRLPAGYLAYEMAFGDGLARRVRGIVGALALEPWGGSILPHEDVMPGPVEDRLALLRATATHLSAIYGTVPGPHPDLAELLERVCAGAPLGEVLDQEGVRHRVWPMDPDDRVAATLGGDHLLIADGHHRYTTALAYRDERRRADGPGPWDGTLAFVVDAATQDVPVLPYHRIQHAGAILDGGRQVEAADALLEQLRDDPPTVGVVTRDAGGELRWRLRDLVAEPPAVLALHREHLDAAAPGDDLTFSHDAADAIDAVRRGDARAAYLLPGTSPATIARVAEAGRRLPRKSTFFWPKPRTGMVMMPLEPTPARSAPTLPAS